MAGKRRYRAAAPVSAEDELLLLQSQALAEEEAAKRKGEMLSRFLQHKLAKEEQSSALSLHKLHAQWRAVLREARAQELRRDVHVLSRAFARVMDCKDGVIEALAADLEEAEEQHGRALRSHLLNVDRLLQLQRCRLACLEDGYRAQLQALQAAFEEERRTIVEQHERERCYLQDMALGTEQNQAKNDLDITLKFQSSRDDIKNESLQEKQYTRLQLGAKLEKLWKQVRCALQGYAEATERQRVAFEALKQKDERTSREVETQAKKLQKLQGSIAAVRSRLVALLWESEEQNRCMREEKEKVLRQLQELRTEMNRRGADAHDSLLRLTLQSSAALKALARVMEKVRGAGRSPEWEFHLPSPPCPLLHPPRPSASCAWPRCAAGWRRRRRRCCPFTHPRWRRKRRKMPSKSSRRHRWSRWPGSCRSTWGWSASGSASTRRSWRSRRWSGRGRR